MAAPIPPATPEPPSPRPVFTTPGRLLIIASLLAIAGAMYWVITTDTIPVMDKILAAGGILLVGCLAIAGGIFFFDGRHRR